MIAGLLRSLAAIPEEKRSFDQAVATLKQNSLMESQGDVESSHVDKLVNSEGDGELNVFASIVRLIHQSSQSAVILPSFRAQTNGAHAYLIQVQK